MREPPHDGFYLRLVRGLRMGRHADDAGRSETRPRASRGNDQNRITTSCPGPSVSFRLDAECLDHIGPGIDFLLEISTELIWGADIESKAQGRDFLGHRRRFQRGDNGS